MRMPTTTRTFLLVFSIMCSLASGAQSLYEIKFSDAGNVQYKALLVFFHENNSYIRVGYYANDQYNVVEVNYRMEYGTAIGGRKYCMLKKTTNPVFITSKKLNQSYNPDYFLWFFNTANNQYDDLYTTDDSTFRSENYRKTISYKQLTPTTLSEIYLREFFGSNESKFLAVKRLCGLEAPAVVLKPLPGLLTTKLHLVLVANTNDPKIGLSCNADRYNLVNQFKQMATAMNIGYKDYIVDGDNFSKSNVISTINSVYPGTNDIVVFVYRGHGFRWENQYEQWPRLALNTYGENVTTNNTNSLGLQEVKEMLDKKGARLNIVLGDCCNNVAGRTTVTGNNFWQYQVSGNTDVSKLRSLFINTKGSIISAAAKPGEVSWAAFGGGLYSMSFVQALEQEISYFTSGQGSWSNILSNTVKYAYSKSMQNCEPQCTPQNGINDVKVTLSY